MKVTCFDEMLWDDFPTGKVLGGAPLNVAARLESLDVGGSIISCRGDDADGEELLRQIKGKNVNTNSLQVSSDQATSLVRAKLNECSSTNYEIVYPCVWDRIRLQGETLQRVAESDALISGSLVTCDEVFRSTLDKLTEKAKFKIFDVDLRKPSYDTDRLLDTVKKVDLAKLDGDELYGPSEIYGSPYHSIEQNIAFLAKLAGVPNICVILGGHGAVLYQKGKLHRHCGFRVKVADTVDSGDSFLGDLTYKLLNSSEPQGALTFTCALDALVVVRCGAMPDTSLQEIENLMNPTRQEFEIVRGRLKIIFRRLFCIVM